MHSHIGGNGVVYHVLRNGRSFAMKALDVVSRRDSVEIAQDEINNMSILNHDRICKLIEVVYYQNYWFLIMPKYDGDVQRLIWASQTPLTDNVLKDIFTQMAEAVQYIHSQEIFHRDIKLLNFLFKITSNSVKVVLADFGAASRIDMVEGFCPCTEGKRSRECAIQKEWSSRKHDIWSLAVALIDLIHPGHNSFEVYYNGLQHRQQFQKVFGLSNELVNLLAQVFRPEHSRLSLKEFLAKFNRIRSLRYQDEKRHSQQTLHQLRNLNLKIH